MLTKQSLIDQLGQLVSWRTVSGDQEANARALDYIVSLINPVAQLKRVQNQGAEILLAGNHHLRQPDFGYMVHVDVVAATEKQWQMSVKGNLAFGRGVSDMKFSIPLGVALLNELIAQNSKTSFTLAVTTDEEVGGLKGGLHLAEKLQFRPKVLIVPDGGDNLQLVNKGKGVAQIKVTSTGRPAHASRIWEGKNALAPLCRLVTQLADKYEVNNRQDGWVTTMNIGQVHGGQSNNQVCPEAWAVLDFRFPEDNSIVKILSKVTTRAEEIDPTLQVEVISSGEPVFTNAKLPILQKFRALLQKHTGAEIPLLQSHGASDARHFAPYKIPVLMSKPMGGDIHSEKEWIDLDSCLEFYQALRELVGLL